MTDERANGGGAVVQVRGLTKRFGDLQVLHGIDFDVGRGEVVALIGPSGGGKSTLLRCVTHLEPVTAGSIRIAGEYLVKDGVYAERRVRRAICLRMGLVFQNFNLFPHFSVMRNLTEAQILVLKRSREEAEKRARALLAKAGLAAKEKAYPCELSGGQQQRAAIARALALDPEVLFFDEPTSALDPELTQEILAVIRELAAEKMTMVIVTHEMRFARDVADRVLFMDGGVIVEQGPAKEIIDAPQMERTQAFLGRFEG
jgi:polar amino acid transport system ATP-binding protein